MQATAPLPWNRQVWTDSTAFQTELRFGGTTFYLSSQRASPGGIGYPYLVIFFGVVREAMNRFEDWVPQTSIEVTIPGAATSPPWLRSDLVILGKLGIDGAVGNIGLESASTSFPINDI